MLLPQDLDEDFCELIDEGLFYLSFADTDAPEGPRFLCGLFTRAMTAEEAVNKVDAAGLNPGGEIKVLEAAEPLLRRLSEIPLDRLLSEEELIPLFGGGPKRPTPAHLIVGSVSQSNNGGRHGHA